MEQDAAQPVDNDSLIGLIEQLTEPAEPPPIPMIPQTWGWAVLAALVLAALAYAVRRWIRHRRANAYRRAALAMLDGAGDDPAQPARPLMRCVPRGACPPACAPGCACCAAGRPA